MKWPVLGLMLLLIPLVAAWLRSTPRSQSFIFFLLSFLPFVIAPWRLYVAPYATPMWSGFVKGWEFSVLDAVAIGVLFGIKGPRPTKLVIAAFAFYFSVVLLSVHQAHFLGTALAYPFQLIRLGILASAVTKAAFRPAGEKALLTGLIAGLVVQLIYAAIAKAGGAIQTGGGLGHQNLLGFVTHMALLPIVAAVLAGKQRGFGVMGVIAGLMIVAFTASRATLVVSGIGLALTLLFSLSMRFTGRKLGLAALSIILISVAVPLAILNLEQRFAVQRTSFGAEDEVRDAFERAAHIMIDERPFGVGPNQYVFVANTEGFSNRAKVDWSPANRLAIVHNAYLLERAESGLLGLIGLILFLFACTYSAFRCAWKFRKTGNAEVLIGIGCGLVAIAIHNFYEWVFFVFTSQYVLAVQVGMMSGIVRRHNLSRAQLAQAVPSGRFNFSFEGVGTSARSATGP